MHHQNTAAPTYQDPRQSQAKEFDSWLDRLGDASEGDELAALNLGLVACELAVLRALDGPPAPEDETAGLERVRQCGRYRVWPVTHAYQPGVAVRLICWFPSDAKIVVVALFAGDAAGIGDVWYNCVGARADAIIGQWERGVRYDRDA